MHTMEELKKQIVQIIKDLAKRGYKTGPEDFHHLHTNNRDRLPAAIRELIDEKVLKIVSITYAHQYELIE